MKLEDNGRASWPIRGCALPFRTAEAHLKGQTIEEKVVIAGARAPRRALLREQYLRGAEIYSRDGHCSTCHQPDGLGLQAGGFPPLAGVALGATTTRTG